MEFFDRSETRPDPQLLATLNQIGVQIGRVFKRRYNEEKLLKNALFDRLTDLPNRALFERSIEDAYLRQGKRGYAPISVIYTNLDGLKLVNDALGHMAGDLLLVEMTSRLRHTVEFYATTPFSGAPDNVMIARMSGNEFAVLVEGESHCDIAMEIAADIHECLGAAHMIETNEVRSMASLGIAHNDGTYGEAAELTRDAELAMYEARSRGTSQTVIFDQAMRSTALERIALEAQLRHALIEEQFVLQYQPIVNIADRRLVGFEALVRWQRGDELVMPDDFLPIIQDAGLMNALGSWVLREACETAASWQRSCPQAEPFHVSVNVTPGQFLQGDFAAQVESIILAANLDPQSLVIEVTENAAITNRELTVRVAQELQALGVRISLDDFGTGYSSFSHLQTLCFDTIKIDRSFVADEHSTLNWSIVDAVLSIASTSEMQVIAEGVENEAQARRLTQGGCVLGQGFFYSASVPAEEALGMLELQAAA